MRFVLSYILRFISDPKAEFPMNGTLKYENYTTNEQENKIQNVGNLVAWDQSSKFKNIFNFTLYPLFF